jgi:predicted nuclease of predicted toxin-antitoxin system
LPDEQVLAKAVAEQRIVLTMDLDFGYLLAISKASLPSVILFRLEDKRSERVNERLSEVLRLCLNDLSAGAIVVVIETTIRVRRLPI